MNEITRLLALANDMAVGNSINLPPRTTISVTRLGDTIRPVVQITCLDARAYPDRIGDHSDRLQISSIPGGEWSYLRIVADHPNENPADMLCDLIAALEEYQR